MLAGQQEPKLISYHCKYSSLSYRRVRYAQTDTILAASGEQGMNCGGLGDRYVLSRSSSVLPGVLTAPSPAFRLLGMTSAFFFGLITKRAVSLWA